MPGIIYHLAFAEEIFRSIKTPISDVDFFSGNLIPDLVVDKKSSHYIVPTSTPGFEVPNMNVVKNKLFDINNSINLGMYCHLYLDHHFINNYLIPEFIFDTDNNEVINPRNGFKWPISQFWAPASKGGILYKGYTQINRLMFEKGHISKKTLDILPNVLPLTGIPTFDNRRELSWRDELNSYLSEHEPYTGEILDYDRLWNAIFSIAQKFVNEELQPF